LVDEAKAFFTVVENFAHLQDSDSSPQRVAFDRSTICFLAVESEFAGVSPLLRAAIAGFCGQATFNVATPLPPLPARLFVLASSHF
jgi:hypothetical protein